MEDLWQQVFRVGTEWNQLDQVYEYNWNFSNLEDALEEGGELHDKNVYLFGCTEREYLRKFLMDALEEGGELHDKNVYLFGCTEPHLVPFRGREIVAMIPAVVAIVSPFPPSDKIAIKSVQREAEEILPMEQMEMDWVPYIPLDRREAPVERLQRPRIFILRCTQRRAGLRHLNVDRVNQFKYCLPYFYNPFEENELEQSTVADILFPIEPPVVCEFDWGIDELEEFSDKLIEDEALPADQKEPFKDFVREKVREAREAIREAREAREKARDEMSEETRAAFGNMKFYKFYPVSTPDTPDVTNAKSPVINRHYGKAHEVF